ncbi:hypothetical protein ACWC5I_00795 [Kitasatospora sp. NPDC001574]
MTEDYQALAQRNAEQAALALRQIPTGPTSTDVMLAWSAKAQAIATTGLIQAVLHLSSGRAATPVMWTDPDRSPDGCTLPPRPAHLVNVTAFSDREPRYVLGKGAHEALIAMGWTPPPNTEGD